MDLVVYGCGDIRGDIVPLVAGAVAGRRESTNNGKRHKPHDQAVLDGRCARFIAEKAVCIVAYCLHYIQLLALDANTSKSGISAAGAG